jgi:hypothetical protein
MTTFQALDRLDPTIDRAAMMLKASANKQGVPELSGKK